MDGENMLMLLEKEERKRQSVLYGQEREAEL